VPASLTGLLKMELTFQQDLNGNGQIGPVTTTIENFGVTHLDHVGNQFFLRDAGGVGPSLKFGGTPFTDGQFGAWTPIGVEKTAPGYEVAIKFGAADQYQVWNLDNNGNFVNAALGTVPGSNSGLRALEPSFQQDLNGDGTIGPPPPSGPTFSSGATMTMISGGFSGTIFGSGSGLPPPSSTIVSLSGGVAHGDDTLTGTSDNDTFFFNQALGPGNVATIVDFVPGSDSIALSRAVFTEAGPAGALNADAFFVGAAAHDADDRVIYDQASGHVMYDADGTGAQAAVTFAVLSTDLPLTEKDFILI
jgi:hypothetical protein